MVLLELSQGCKLGMPRPITMDWVDLAYFSVAIFVSFLAAYKSEPKSKRHWWIVGTVLMLFALNKFLFFDNCIKNALSGFAAENGFYVSRRGVQLLFILLLLGLQLALIYLCRQRVNKLDGCLRRAYWGLLILLVLVMLRIISLHQIDGMLYLDKLGLGIGLNWIVEIFGSLFIIINAAIYIRKQGSSN